MDEISIVPNEYAVVTVQPTITQAARFVACYENHLKVISECSSIEAAQIFIDSDKLYEAFFRITKDTESERLAKIARKLAEAKCGEWLAKIKSQKVGRKSFSEINDPSVGNLSKRDQVPKGISEKTAREYQKLARIPEPHLSNIIKMPDQRLSIKAIVDKAKEQQQYRQPIKTKQYRKPKEDILAGRRSTIERKISELDNGLQQALTAYRYLRRAVEALGGLTDTDRTAFIDQKLEQIAKTFKELEELFAVKDTRNILKVIK